MAGVTNVNPGNNGPRGGSSRIPNDREADRYEDRHIDDRYDNTSDGSFDEAYEEYYDAPADPAPRGKHRRVEDSATAGAAAAHPGAEAYADTEYIDADYATEYDAEYADGQYATDYAVADDAEYADDRYADHSDPADYDEYDEYADDDRTAVVPAAAGAGAAAEGSSAVAAGGVPKRGLAMILIAVAVLLGLWGIYAMTQNDSSDRAADQQNQAGQDPNAQNGQNGQNPQNPANPQDPNNPANPGQNPQDPNNPNAQNPANPQDPNRAPDAAPAGNGQPMTQENETINVYNNSTVPNLAADVSEQLKGQGTKVGEVGNINEAQAILEQNTVFFDPATPGAEERARVLADRVGGIAKANDPTVPREAAKPGSLTLVLTGPVTL